MITYVNTVLVGKGVGTLASGNAGATDAAKIAAATNGQYIIVDNNGALVDASTAPYAEAIKVGLKTASGIKWSNLIKRADIKSYTFTEYAAESEDVVTIDFSKAATVAASQTIRVVVRLTFKDLPTKYRKWTESYEVEVPANVSITKGDIVDLFVTSINTKNAKRARVTASKSSNNLVLTAMSYDDDNTVDSISPANKVRFSANAWLTKPEATGFASKNKYAAAAISKVAGTASVGSWKLVRDAEAQAMGYLGILNRGEGTYPIIKPGMNVNPDKTYDTLTLEFENMYRSADDLFRKTKQTLQVFECTDATKTIDAASASLMAVLNVFVKGGNATAALGTRDTHEPTAAPQA